MSFTAKLQSRKFLIVVVTFVVGAATELFSIDLDPNVVYGFIAVALGFIGVEGLADNSSRKLDGSFAVKMLQAQLEDIQAQTVERAGEIGQDAVPGGFPDSSIGAFARERAANDGFPGVDPS